MISLRVVVEGEPSTDHRPRFSGMTRGAKPHPIMRSSSPFRAWKADCSRAATIARAVWEEEHGADWPTEDMRYAVRCLGFLRADRKDADSIGRGFLDACQGVLWRNDRACRPVILDCDTDRNRQRLEVDVIAYDPAEALVSVRLEYREDG